MPTPTNKDIDGTLSALSWAPELIIARERLQAMGLGAKADLAKSLLRKLPVRAAALELGLHAIEAARIANSPEVRESRVEEAKDLAKQSVARRLFAAADNPVGLTYGAGALVKEAEDTRSDPRLREQDLAYLNWRAERDFAAARKARSAGPQQRGRALMLARSWRTSPQATVAPSLATGNSAAPGL
jgi:hypothetical protein